jgi:hypothetical protein
MRNAHAKASSASPEAAAAPATMMVAFECPPWWAPSPPLEGAFGTLAATVVGVGVAPPAGDAVGGAGGKKSPVGPSGVAGSEVKSGAGGGGDDGGGVHSMGNNGWCSTRLAPPPTPPDDAPAAAGARRQHGSSAYTARSSAAVAGGIAVARQQEKRRSAAVPAF